MYSLKLINFTYTKSVKNVKIVLFEIPTEGQTVLRMYSLKLINFTYTKSVKNVK